ncbi:uncharacterized protein LOC127112046 [Lathyrus oleraceus]|uniref:uncharacterized protein LOC127112046 n=1 Tax=Pisum sativum TaxID=3888 RepID=UPI0021D32E61|nr:uncharacterized protein LOC127112046 [Pisum sativum]
MPGLKRELVELKPPIKDGKKPTKQTPRRFAPEILSKIKKEVERLLRCNFIRTTRHVEWIANIVPVIKKNGSLRVCIDFRDLNAATPKDEYPMPVAEMLVDSVAGYEYLSMLDRYSGYNQIFIAKEDVSKTAFRCPGTIGTYEWIIMPFGLKNAGVTYQRAMNSIFHDYIETFMQAGDFLGFVVHKKGIEINHNKTKAIMETKTPSTKKELQSLLGKINFLRRFISNLSGRTQAFSPLLRLKQGKFEWNDEHQKEFDTIKQYLTNPHILSPPCGKKPMRLYISASDTTIGSMAMKGQIISDFIVDHAVVESPQLQVELKPWRLFFDDSTHKDGSGVGIMIISPGGIQTKLKCRIEGPLCSNNEAKYETLIAGLEDIKHVPRIKNQEANDLAQITSGYRISKEKLEELVEVRGKAMAARLSPTDLESTQLGYANKEEFEVLTIDTLMDTDWRNPIMNYLKDPSIDTERKTKYRALSYVLMGNELFKKTPEGILLKCLGENEAYLALTRKPLKDIKHVPRIKNQEANDLAQITSGYRISKEKLEELVEVRGKAMAARLSPTDLESTQLGYANKEEFEVLTIDNLMDTDWRNPIMNYLKDPSIDTERKTKYRALSYVLMGNELFKKTPEGILLKCLGENEAYLTLTRKPLKG